MSYYGIASGRNIGIVSSWNECEREVAGYPGAVFKKFDTAAEASNFVQQYRGCTNTSHSCGYGYPGSSGNYNSASCGGSGYAQYGSSSSAYGGGNYSSGRPTGYFRVDSEGYLIVYTDGSCENNGQFGAKAGIGVFFDFNHPCNVSEPVRGRATNNTAELQAATRALEIAKREGFGRVKVRTDSMFLKDCFECWMPNWKRNGWKKAGGGNVMNRDDLQRLDYASKGLFVRIEYVPAHSGDPGNEAADRFAREGAKRYVN